MIGVVDDDESVREATKGLMRSLGFAAEAYASAKDFLASPDLGRIACLIADLNMPEMSGIELHGYLVAGHGLYAWGRNMKEAHRHVEAFEFLFDCALRSYNVSPRSKS